MSIYPYPQNITSFEGFINYFNLVTAGWGMTLFLVAIFFVSFFSLKIYRTHQAFAAASFITFIAATIFRVLKFISTKVLLVSIIALVAGIVWLLVAEKIEY